MTSIHYLKQCFRYDSSTGLLYRKRRPIEHFKTVRAFSASNARLTIDPVGVVGVNKNGKKYMRVNLRIDGKNKFYLVHRVAWAIENGFEPEFIDHINGNGLDNRLKNLRNVSVTENNRNMRLFKSNTTGRVGVYDNKNGKWVCYIWDKKKQINLGTFETFNEAVAARAGAEKLYGYHRNHGDNRNI